MKTHTKKTLEALRNAGEKGVHSFHLNLIVGTTRSAARIRDLKEEGYLITSTPEKMGNSYGVRYTLQEQIQEDKPVANNYRWVFNGSTARRVQE